MCLSTDIDRILILHPMHSRHKNNQKNTYFNTPAILSCHTLLAHSVFLDYAIGLCIIVLGATLSCIKEEQLLNSALGQTVLARS